jgi:hypothetical protein
MLTKAIETGNSKELAEFFNMQIDLSILGNEINCSKTQAEFIVKKFFMVNPLEKFSIIHHGEKEKSNYLIGKYETNKSCYRFYLLLKNVPDGAKIFQIRIENDNGEF